MRVLAVNAGSSSVKLSLIADGQHTIAERQLVALGDSFNRVELGRALAEGLSEADTIAHRIVHGGERFHDAVVLDEAVVGELRELTDLAPLHQPKSLAAMDAVSGLLPALPAVACFDTAFHATLPAEAFTYALPQRWRERWGIRRFGFHGLSHSWVARRATELLGAPARIVSCHLGAGASLCAIRDRRSVDTTMGFTPLEGLVMATRSGSVDPGLLLWLLEREKVSESEMASALEHESGLTGLAGRGDMEQVVADARVGARRSALALDVYVHRLRSGIAAMAASLGGIDALVFTGGVGEHEPSIRARAAAGLRFIGVGVDEHINASVSGDTEVTAQDATVKVLVLRAREDLEMARQAELVLNG